MSGNKHPAHKNNVKDAKVDKDPNVDLQTVQNKKYKGDANMAGSGYHNATKATSTEVATGVAEKDFQKYIGDQVLAGKALK